MLLCCHGLNNQLNRLDKKTGMKTQPPLAKLSRPRLYDAVARSRLFAILDQGHQHPLVWICAPPGAGKTTLVASYLEARKRSGIWYQIDKADADPAGFFYYLRLAADSSVKGKRVSHAPLPLLTPEHLVDLPAFARHFFRELFARLPRRSTLVLDNFQELDENTALHDALAAGFSEIPPGFTVFVLSRTDHPNAYARLAANGARQLIDWEDLKLTFEECRDIAVSQQPVPESMMRTLLERSGGWAAGLRLLLERLRHGSDVNDLTRMESLQTVFDYFAEQIFSQIPLEHRTLLLQLAYLPRITPKSAEQLTGNPSASRLLEYLYRRHLFVDRRSRPDTTFQFHALFRSFLQQRATEELDSSERAALSRRAAELLLEEGATEDAIELQLETNQFASAAELLRGIAARLIAQGRWKTLLEWLGRLPEELFVRDAWLLHWRGAALCAADPLGAREPLTRAFKLAAQNNDERCQLLTAAVMVDSYFLEYSSFQPLDNWIPALERILLDNATFTNAEEELQLLSALAMSSFMRRGPNSVVAQCIERMFEMLRLDLSANIRSRACFQILMYANAASMETGQRLLPIVRPLLEDPAVTALNRAMCNFILSWYCCCVGDYEQGMAAVMRVDRIAQNEGLPFVARLAAIIGTYLEATHGDLVAARARILQMERDMIPTHLYDCASLSGMWSWFAAFNGEPRAAQERGRAAVDIFDRMGSFMHPIMYRLPLAWAACEEGQIEVARHWLNEAEELSQLSGCVFWRPPLAAIHAWLARREGDVESLRQRLCALFTEAQQTRYGSMLAWLPQYMPKLCADALSAGIETEYVSTLIRQHGWKPPSPDVEQWPWPIEIHTLGKFRVLREQRAIEFGRKSPKKLLQLAKALIAFGAQGVSEQRITDALWPDLHGDAAREALSIAVKRLRELLGSGDVIRHQEGRVSLDDEICWIDAHAFERKLEASTRAQTVQALGLYRGSFLAEELDARWALQTRERLRSKFIRALSSEAAALEKSADWESALRLYLKGLEADDLAESFYQGVMHCLLEQGKRAEALSTYRRMRQILSVVLGIQPSKDSDALYQRATQDCAPYLR
jgi:LuxR family transcriptional regulator, maltose regulon positive regulatory protein